MHSVTGLAQAVPAAQGVHLIAASVGFLSFFFIWLAVVWGFVLRHGWTPTWVRHATIHGTHQIVALLGLTLGIVHAFAQLAGPTGAVRLIDVLVPFTNLSDPVGIGIGVVALEVMVATTLSVLIQRRLGYNRWRALHALNYVAFMLLTGHILVSGSDVRPPYVWGTVVGAFAITMLLWLSTVPQFGDARRRASDRVRGPRREQEIAVGVDAGRCSRYGFCQHEAPDVFMLRADGRLAYRAAVPTDMADDVVRAVKVCPMRAITLSRVPTAVVSAGRDEAERPTEPHMTQPRGVPAASVTGTYSRGEQR